MNIQRILASPFLLAALLVSACASSANLNRDVTQPSVELFQTRTNPNLAYMRGPIPLDYIVRVTNNADIPITLRSLELRTVGIGAYNLNTGSSPITKVIPPHASVDVPIVAWGYTQGGYLTASAPVTIRGIARFESQKGALQKVFITDLAQGELAQ